LDGVYLKARELRLEPFGTAGDVATGTHAGDQVVEAVGEVGEDLGGGGVAVNLDVGGVAELHGHPAVGVFGDQGAGLFDAAPHAEFPGGEHQFGAQGRHVFAPLDGHGFGHGEDQAVALHRAHHGEGDAGVEIGRAHV